MTPGPAEAFAQIQEVIQPSPTAVSWIVAVAEFPDLKGTTQRYVALDAYHQLGLQRAFLEAGAAAALGRQLLEAAKLAENRGVQIIEGHQAITVADAARRPTPARSGRFTPRTA